MIPWKWSWSDPGHHHLLPLRAGRVRAGLSVGGGEGWSGGGSFFPAVPAFTPDLCLGDMTLTDLLGLTSVCEPEQWHKWIHRVNASGWYRWSNNYFIQQSLLNLRSSESRPALSHSRTFWVNVQIYNVIIGIYKYSAVENFYIVSIFFGLLLQSFLTLKSSQFIILLN